MRLLLFSDLHLDAAFPWAGADLARARRRALREALRRIGELAQSLRVDAVCCAGDLFEHDRCAPDTVRVIQDVFASLDPIPVLVAPGEQDWFGPASPYRYVSWSRNVHVFDEPRLKPYSLPDSVTIWGAAHCAPAHTPGFLDGFRVDRGGVNLALFHGCERDEHARQEPADAAPVAPFRAQQVPEAGLRYALVGHHGHPSASAYHAYAGNPEPLTFGEPAGGRGAVLVTVQPGGHVDTQLYGVARTRMHDVEVSLDGAATTGDVRARLAQALASASGIVRATVVGSVSPTLDLDAALADLAGIDRHLDGLVVRRGRVTAAYDVGALARERTVRGSFVDDVLAAEESEERRTKVLVTGLRALDGRTDLAVS